jgi:hypothetical protein
LAVASLVLNHSVVAWYLVTQVASSTGVRIIKAAPDLSALTGVGVASSALWESELPEDLCADEAI